MTEMLEAVQRFRSWAAVHPGRSGEWECDYDDWAELHSAVDSFIGDRPFSSWSSDEVMAVLYAMARDNETGFLAQRVSEKGAALVLVLSAASLRTGDADARWQLAEALGQLAGDSKERDDLLRGFSKDENEYVRRMALKSSALVGGSDTEAFAEASWNRVDSSQEHSRMMAIWALRHIASPRLEALLEAGQKDERPYLRQYASRMRLELPQRVAAG